MFKYQPIPISRLRSGLRLWAPIYDPNDPKTKLLGAGIEIDDTLIDRLRERGVYSVIVSNQDLARINAFQSQGKARNVPPQRRQCSMHSTDLSRQLDREIESVLSAPEEPEHPFANVDHADKGSYSRAAMHEAAEQHENRVDSITSVYRDLHSSKFGSIDPLIKLCTQSMQAMLEDIDLFVCLAVNPYSSDYPYRHSLHTAITALGIGIRMHLGERLLKDLALGCLLHDLGMLELPESLYRSDRILEERSFAEITNHPVLVFEKLQSHLDKVPRSSQIIIYQMHERLDGSGYPRGRHQKLMFMPSAIACVADVYAATVANRPHRPGLHPYYAILNLLQGCHDGLFDPEAMRGLLQTVSLFPIGSCYEMNEGRMARVIRSNPMKYDRPVVELWDDARMQGEPAVVDMRQDAELQIVRAFSGVS